MTKRMSEMGGGLCGSAGAAGTPSLLDAVIADLLESRMWGR